MTLVLTTTNGTIINNNNLVIKTILNNLKLISCHSLFNTNMNSKLQTQRHMNPDLFLLCYCILPCKFHFNKFNSTIDMEICIWKIIMIIKGAAKVQNRQGINTTRKNSKKHYQIFEKTLPKCKQKHYHYLKNHWQIFEKTLPKSKKHYHYQPLF